MGTIFWEKGKDSCQQLFKKMKQKYTKVCCNLTKEPTVLCNCLGKPLASVYTLGYTNTP